jgi:hypothetical protein
LTGLEKEEEAAANPPGVELPRRSTLLELLVELEYEEDSLRSFCSLVWLEELIGSWRLT